MELLAPLAADAASSSTSMDRTALYETLYASHGYHANLNVSHAAELIEYVVLPRFPDSANVRVLDVGCSHGRGVQMLWEQGCKRR